MVDKKYVEKVLPFLISLFDYCNNKIYFLKKRGASKDGKEQN